MQFFKKSLWEKINSQDPCVRNTAEQEWLRSQENYNLLLQRSLRLATKKEKEVISFCENAHDCLLNGMRVSKKHNKWLFEISISIDNETCVNILFQEVVFLHSDLTISNNLIKGNMSMGYCEFLKGSDSFWEVSFLCDLCNEFNVRCKTFRMVL